ncbi:transcription factor bHLH36-like isoform X2 [Daucus carota subsp. sativus]|uniref:transcription factor bHLH36-like isoform X2 n=1 Tax=Daucus carota subsp. sativus TaxID=79200 RepID=UPI0030826FA8
MYFFNQGDELVFQIQNFDNPNPEQQTIQQDPVMNRDSSCSRGRNKRHGKEVLSIGEDCKDDERSKKIMHREIERQRRQDMGKLHVSLRSLLPLEFIKGKRSISDHMEQAVNYINHLQGEIRELDVKKNNLIKSTPKKFFIDDPGKGTSDLCLLDDNNDISVTVTPCFCGVEIIITSGSMEENLSLSGVMQVLIQERQLNVTSCSSTRVNDQLVHIIRAEIFLAGIRAGFYRYM